MGDASGRATRPEPALLPPMNVVITGGSSGIGRAIVRQFCEAGHNVLFTYYRNKVGASDLVRTFPDNAHSVHCDQGDVVSISKLYRSVEKWLDGRSVDGLINNAALGSATVDSYHNLSPIVAPNDKECDGHLVECFRQAQKDEALMRVNALGPLWVTKTLLPLMRGPDRSVIIMIGSVGGSTNAFPEYTPSDLMSKSAVAYLTRHLAAEHVHDHIDVICLSPGATNTEMFRKSTLEKLSDSVEGFISKFPKGRLLETDEIAATCLWLTTQKSARILHGAVIDASMGLGVRPGLQTECRQR